MCFKWEIFLRCYVGGKCAHSFSQERHKRLHKTALSSSLYSINSAQQTWFPIVKTSLWRNVIYPPVFQLLRSCGFLFISTDIQLISNTVLYFTMKYKNLINFPHIFSNCNRFFLICALNFRMFLLLLRKGHSFPLDIEAQWTKHVSKVLDSSLRWWDYNFTSLLIWTAVSSSQPFIDITYLWSM